MENFKFIIFILTLLITLSALIEKIKVPHPAFFVIVGAALGFSPIFPDLILKPEVVFMVFLPPLLYDAAFKTSWHEFKTDITPISALAVSLVCFTTLMVGAAAYLFIPGFTWSLGFLLGAIISPPDAVAATNIIRGLGLNRRIVAILEGESLVNDATALIVYKYALIAVATGNFIFWKASFEFMLVAMGGIVIGSILGYLFTLIHQKIISNPVIETNLTLLTPFVSFLAAEQLHTSGILSVVCTGLVVSWRSPKVFSPNTRMQALVVWDTLIFLLNGFVFILIGLQLRATLKQLDAYSIFQLAGFGAIISMATIVARFLWVFAGAYLVRPFLQQPTTDMKQDNAETWKNVLIISWTGTRGIISLAAALALPLVLAGGEAFPQRSLILYLCFAVIFITLIVQGLSLPLLVRILGIKPGNTAGNELRELELYIITNTLSFIDEEFSSAPDTGYKLFLKEKYNASVKKLETDMVVITNENKFVHAPLTSLEQAQRKVQDFQRSLLFKLHKEGLFSPAAIKSVEHSMDIHDMRSDEERYRTKQ